MEFCNLNAQYSEYKSEIDAAISKVLSESRYVFGPEIQQFENELFNYSGAKAIACANGTDALLLALMAANVGPGDEVITSPFTFIATAEAISFLGAKPVFVDVNESDFNINPTQIASAITPKTKVILPVSLFGLPSAMLEINEIAKARNLLVIEDAAQSFGAEYRGKKSCNLSDIATTSFFPAKPLGCYGDGGAVFTNNPELEAKIRQLANHGQSERYHHDSIGMNSRLDTLQAAILLVKLKHYEQDLSRRRQAAQYYTKSLKDHHLTPQVFSDRESVWAQYTLRTENRDQLQAKLTENKIPSAIYYPIPLHLQKCFASSGYQKGDFPIAEKLAQEVISLPMSAHITREEQDQIISCM